MNYYENHFVNKVFFLWSMKFAFYLVVILPNQKPDPESKIRIPNPDPESGSESRIRISDPVKSWIRNQVKTWIRYIPIPYCIWPCITIVDCKYVTQQLHMRQCQYVGYAYMTWITLINRRCKRYHGFCSIPQMENLIIGANNNHGFCFIHQMENL